MAALAAPHRPAALSWLLRALVMLLAAACVVRAYQRAARLDFDFHHFQRDAAYLWQHGALNPDRDNPDESLRRQLPFYLPTVTVLFFWIGAVPVKAAALLWAMMQGGALALSYLVIWRWCRAAIRAYTQTGVPHGDRDPDTSARHPAQHGHATLPPTAGAIVNLATLICGGAILEAAKFNQLSFVTLALCLLGVELVVQRRAWPGGVALAAAAALKLLPALFIGWLVVKRRWAALAVYLLALPIIILIPPWLVFGRDQTWRYHVEWWEHNITHGAPMQRGDSAARPVVHFFDHRNQSLAAVLARLSGQTPTSLQLGAPAANQARVIAICMLLVLLVFTRGRRGEPRATAQRHAAAFLIMMLALSPLVRTYYLVWAWPAIALCLSAALAGCGGPRHAAILALALWAGGMIGWTMPAARLYGVHLWMLILMVGCVVTMSPRGRGRFSRILAERV